MSISILEPVGLWPDNAIMNHCSLNSHLVDDGDAHESELDLKNRNFASLLKRDKSKKSGWFSIRWLMACTKTRLKALFASVNVA